MVARWVRNWASVDLESDLRYVSLYVASNYERPQFRQAISISYSARLRRSNFKLYGMWNAAAGARNAHSARAKCHWQPILSAFVLRNLINSLDYCGHVFDEDRCVQPENSPHAHDCTQLTGCFLRQNRTMNRWTRLNRRKGEISFVRDSFE